MEKNIDENDTNAFRYCGEYYDKETATVYLRARNYNPSTGRFISRDSYSGKKSDPLSLSLYTYCRNNPIRYIDPSGHITVNSQWDWAYYVAKGDINYEYDGGEGTYGERAQKILTYSRAKSSASVSEKNNSKIPGTSINRVDPSQTVAKNLPEYNRLDTKETKINATYVYQTLYDKGWSKNAICAVLGNMDEESCGVNPGKHQAYDGPGYGIVQWDPASKYLNWAQNNGYADDSLEGQVEFLVESMQPGMGEWLPDNSSVPDGYGMSYSDFISSSADVSYLAQVFVYCYERPSEPHMDQRINYAVYWREKYFN